MVWTVTIETNGVCKHCDKHFVTVPFISHFATFLGALCHIWGQKFWLSPDRAFQRQIRLTCDR